MNVLNYSRQGNYGGLGYGECSRGTEGPGPTFEGEKPLANESLSAVFLKPGDFTLRNYSNFNMGPGRTDGEFQRNG